MLPKGKKMPSTKEIKNQKSCKYHQIIGHSKLCSFQGPDLEGNQRKSTQVRRKTSIDNDSRCQSF